MIKRRRMSAHRKGPNALKHGAFAKVTLLPGEEPQQFIRLLAELFLEWQPSGPTEQDAVLSIAKGIWRKARFQHFLKGTVARCTADPDHPAYDIVSMLRRYYDYLDSRPDELDTLDLDNPMIFVLLPKQMRQHLTEEFAKEKFKSTSEQAEAIKKYIGSLLLGLEKIEKPVELSYIESAKIVTPEDFQREVAVNIPRQSRGL
jgi:hypothetical protein